MANQKMPGCTQEERKMLENLCDRQGLVDAWVYNNVEGAGFTTDKKSDIPLRATCWAKIKNKRYWKRYDMCLCDENMQSRVVFKQDTRFDDSSSYQFPLQVNMTGG
mmetsp:Transcript_8528/g.15498  ORF Transcript_8528/g.15498 Transcript_8528/m.15498 type:complete len:106 (-) Transcript_8528:26-343(-)